MGSRHLTGRAVGLGATVDGDVRIGRCTTSGRRDARLRSNQARHSIVWGGGSSHDDLARAGGTQDDGKARCQIESPAGRKASSTGPHFQLDKARY